MKKDEGFTIYIKERGSDQMLVRVSDGTYSGCNTFGEVIEDSVVLGDGSVAERSEENLATARRWQ